MKSFGPLYAGSLRYWHKKFFPIFEVGTTQETEHPYRKGKCIVARVPLTETGRYLGVWVKNPNIHPDDDEAIDKIYEQALVSRKAWEPTDGAYDDFF